MLLRFLLNLIKPSNEQLRSKTAGKLTHLKVGLYQSILKQLLKTYLHYAIWDTIIVSNENIKIVHEFRDLGFENECARNNLGLNSDMINHSFPLSSRKSGSVRHFHYFKFKNLLSLYVDGTELFIKHDDLWSIDGTVKGKIRCSSKNSCISQSIIEILSSQRKIEVSGFAEHIQSMETLDKNENSGHRQKSKKTSQNLFAKEKDTVSVSYRNNPKSSKNDIRNDKHPKAIEKKGFDIDASF